MSVSDISGKWLDRVGPKEFREYLGVLLRDKRTSENVKLIRPTKTLYGYINMIFLDTDRGGDGPKLS